LSPGCCRGLAKLHHVIFTLIAAISLILDLFTKWLFFNINRDMSIIPGFLEITLARNEGAVFGIFAGRKWFLLILALIAVVVIVYIQFRKTETSFISSLSLGLLLGGALGNIYDRIVFGSVRDFIDVHIGSRHWPTFNLADAFLCVGVGLLITIMIIEDLAVARKKSEEADTQNS